MMLRLGSVLTRLGQRSPEVIDLTFSKGQLLRPLHVGAKLSATEQPGRETLPKLTYDEAFRQSVDRPEDLWADLSRDITWHKPWNKVLDDSKSPFTKWFVGGEVSMCYNAVDRHVDAGFGHQVALIHDSPVTQSHRTFTYSELQKEVSKFAGYLASQGVKKGDRVLIYMPMIPQAIITMLAIVRLGAIHSLVFGGFSAKELAKRIRHAGPKVIVTASCGVEPKHVIEYKPILDEAIRLSNHNPKKCLIFQRRGFPEGKLNPGIDIEWNEARELGKPHDCVPIEANEDLYLLYTSGTTGDPKGILRPAGGHAVVLNWTMSAIYGMKPGETWWAASDLGWVVGHSYICYAPLIHRNATVVYEGKPVGTPDAGQFFRVIQDNKVDSMFTAPTALRAIRREDEFLEYGKKYDISSLRALFVAGEHLDHETRSWGEKHLKVPVLDNWWQTETGHAIAANCVGLGNKLSPPKDASGKGFPGFNVMVLRDDRVTVAGPMELGRIVCKLPLPPGSMSNLYKNPDRFIETYFQDFPGYYDTADAGFMDKEGYVYVVARDDDVINVAGHRLSTSALEEAVQEHPDVTDCAVIGVPDEMKGEIPLALYVRRKGCKHPAEVISKELVQVVRDIVGPVAAFRKSIEVQNLPRTRSGKTARKTIQDLAKNKQVIIPGTIEDPTVYVDIKKALQSIGYALTAPDPK